MKFGFLGFGSMGRAIAEGLIGQGVCTPEDISACAAHFDRLQTTAAALGIHAEPDVLAVAQRSDIIIPAVLPSIVEDVLRPILPALKDKLLVSIVSGWDFARYEALLLPGTRHISTIPNTPIAVGAGVLAYETQHNLPEADYAQFCQIFGQISLLVPVTAAQFDAAGTMGGCTPAFTAMYLEALGDAGVKYGLSREAAYKMAAQVLIGTGRLYLARGAHPGAIKDGVCSPGGTTIRGVAELEKRAFRGTIIAAVDAIEGK